MTDEAFLYELQFLLTPLREGRHGEQASQFFGENFYSRPCGRGDQRRSRWRLSCALHFYSRPCGRGDV